MLDEARKLDLAEEEKVVVELKSTEKPKPVFQAQFLTCRTLTGRRLGLLITFNVPVIQSGIKRTVL